MVGEGEEDGFSSSVRAAKGARSATWSFGAPSCSRQARLHPRAGPFPWHDGHDLKGWAIQGHQGTQTHGTGATRPHKIQTDRAPTTM